MISERSGISDGEEVWKLRRVNDGEVLDSERVMIVVVVGRGDLERLDALFGFPYFPLFLGSPW